MSDSPPSLSKASRFSATAVITDHVSSRRKLFASGIGAVIGTNACEALIPKVMQYATDSLMQFDAGSGPSLLAGHFSAATVTVLVLTGALMLQAWFRRLWRLSLGQETHRVGASLKSSLWHHIQRLPTSRLHTDLSLGTLMSTVTSDVNTARPLFGWSVIGITDMMMLSALTSLGMLSIAPKITVIVLLVFLPVPFLVFLLAKAEHRLHHKAQESLSVLHDQCAKAVATARLQKLANTGIYWQRLLAKSTALYQKRRLIVLLTSHGFIVLLGAVPVVAYSVLLLNALPAIEHAQLSVGGFIALLAYTRLLQSPVSDIGFMIMEWQQGHASLERVCSIINQPTDEMHYPSSFDSTLCPTRPSSASLRSLEQEIKPSRGASMIPGNGSGELRVTGLTAFHPGSEIPCFRDLSFTVPPGGRIGIRGSTGAGKTTLLHTIAGLNPRFNGSITWQGTALNSSSIELFRSHLTLVPQQPFLFASTLRDNLCLDGYFTDEELWEMLAVVELADEFAKLPHLLDTTLGELGVNLSGGQRQRLTLARALLRPSALLLFDDILSAVDTVTEDRILANIDRLCAGTSLLWVAHRPSTLRLCSSVIDLDSFHQASSPTPSGES